MAIWNGFFILLVVIFSQNALADSEFRLEGEGRSSADESRKVDASSSQADAIAVGKDSAQNAGEAAKAVISCSQLTDNYCKDIWQTEGTINGRRGNREAADGKFFLGKTPNGAMSMARRIDLEALLNAEERLPEDLRKEFQKKNLLAKLRDLLSREEDTKYWKRSLAEVEKDIVIAMGDTTDNRTRKHDPDAVDSKSPTVESAAKVNADIGDLNNQLLEAKYLNSPQWKRVEKVYEKAKTSIMKRIQVLAVSDAEKERLTEKVKTIKLQLPYNDVRKWNGFQNDMGCDTSAVNAFYHRESHAATVCAGLFNSMQSDFGLLMVIGHEISHAIDPEGCSFDHGEKNSPYAEIRIKLIETNGRGYECADWDKKKSEMEQLAKNKKPLVHTWEKLSECLRQKEELEPINEELLDRVSKLISKQNISNMASANQFTNLVSKKIRTEEDGEIENKDYLNPRRAVSRDNSGFPIFSKWQQYQFFFTQEYICQQEKNKESTPEKWLDQSIAEMEKIQISAARSETLDCTNECRYLQSFGAAKNTNESFADWMSFSVLLDELKKEKDISKRQVLAAASMTMFCDTPNDRYAPNPDAVRVEKKYSLRQHPGNRMRRLSLYGREMRAVLGCSKDQELLQSPADCELK